MNMLFWLPFQNVESSPRNLVIIIQWVLVILSNRTYLSKEEEYEREKEPKTGKAEATQGPSG